MSRFGDDYWDEEFNNQAEFWHTNTQRALAGKRGRRALAELREALRALPDKRLISGALCTVGGVNRRDVNEWTRPEVAEKVASQGEGVCAIGAFLWHRKVKAGADPQAAFEELPMLLDSEEDGSATATAGERAGLTYTLAYHLAYRNDEHFADLSPEERYRRFLAWIDHRLADEVGAST